MVMTWIFGILSLLFLAALLCFNGMLYKEGRKEKNISHGYTGSGGERDREAVRQTLRSLQGYYEKRDLTQIDRCIDETMELRDILILGTSPREVFKSRQEVRNLLYGDWKFWGKVSLDTDQAAIDIIGDAAYVLVKGEVKLNIWRLRVPLKLTGLLLREDEEWRINKLRFAADYNANNVIMGLLSSAALAVSLLLFVISLLCRI